MAPLWGRVRERRRTSISCCCWFFFLVLLFSRLVMTGRPGRSGAPSSLVLLKETDMKSPRDKRTCRRVALADVALGRFGEGRDGRSPFLRCGEGKDVQVIRFHSFFFFSHVTPFRDNHWKSSLTAVKTDFWQFIRHLFGNLFGNLFSFLSFRTLRLSEASRLGPRRRRIELWCEVNVYVYV